MQTGCLTSQQQHRNHHYSMFISPSNGPNSPNCVLTRPREQCKPSAHNPANYHPILSELLQGGSYDGSPSPPPPPRLTHKNNIQFVPLNLFKVEQLVPARIFSPNAYPIRFHWNLVASPLANGCRILLRFCKFSADKNRQVDQLPDSFYLSINSRTVSMKPRKYSHPFDITELFDSCRGCEITLRVAPDLCSPECTVDFYFGLFLAKKVDIEHALAKFKATKPQPSEVTLNLIRRSLWRDDDGDVEVEVSSHFVRVSLLCSYSFTRMSLPVRSIKCEHIGCFDGVAFFTVNNNRSHPRWKCPICQIAIQLDELVIDGLFMALLGAIPADCTEANVYPDGKFEYCKQNRQTILGKQDRCSCAHCTRLGGLLVASRKRKAEWITIED